MSRRLSPWLALLPISVASPLLAASTPVTPASAQIQGDYVEARTASVFAGACHYNGELVTTGNDAVAAWNIKAGSWKGVDLTGVRAMAAIASDSNLGDAHATRHCELLIDTAATPVQAAALADWIGSHRDSLGNITAVRRGLIHFNHENTTYTVAADRFASLNVQAMPNDDCCTQPSLVWYAPLQNLEHRKVGYTVAAAYTAGNVGDPWKRGDENSAFYGTFAE